MARVSNWFLCLQSCPLKSIFQTASSWISRIDLTMSFPILPFKSFLMDLSCFLWHTRSPMNRPCLHLSLIPHLSRLFSSHSSLKCYAPARKTCSWFLPYLLFCIWLLELLRLYPLPELPFICIWLTPLYPLKINSAVTPPGRLSCLLLNTSLPKQD